jgi:hypothetical protein
MDSTLFALPNVFSSNGLDILFALVFTGICFCRVTLTDFASFATRRGAREVCAHPSKTEDLHRG